ncbi:hypothetical protein [Polynucleobacter sp. JS-Polo-80-F4]|uniref:hypothetical protein n=1 Tax=Polynucleobacter sp. JS-Polo-80-F4 TaxID=2576918 RepID=UPI001C0D46B4|nr:hypothetical protein [Polynucleobacter sp. JS-Polo-80-F4]MBU3617275.1 hypothetical protein [Polynucleobacter sp. JS-Polo-80-F4]
MATEKKAAVKLNKDESSLWKLLSSRELGSIQQGIDIACSLGDEVSGLLSGVSIREATGELLRNSRFSGTGPAQPYLDFALLAILSGAPEGSKAAELKTKVRKLVITIPGVPRLQGFTALEDLQIMIQDGCHLEDLTAFGAFPALTHLSISGEMKTNYGTKNSSLNSLKGLDAPQLTVVNLAELKLQDIGSLGEGGCLKELNLQKNENLLSIDSLAPSASSLSSLNLADCKLIKNIDALKGAINLVNIDLSSCESLESITGLKESAALSTIDLVGCEALRSLEGLEGKKILAKDESQYIHSSTFSLHGCSALVNLQYFPDLDPEISTLKLSNMESLKDLSGIPGAHYITDLDLSWSGAEDMGSIVEFINLTTLDLSNAPSLVDASPLGKLKNLTKLELSYSEGLKKLPKSWDSELVEIGLNGCKSLESIEGLPATLGDVSGRWGVDIDLGGCSNLKDIGPLKHTKLIAKNKIDLSECDQLKTLAGLDAFHDITLIQLPACIEDVSSLQKFKSLTITVDLEAEKKFPKSLAKALSQLDVINLVVKGFMLEDCSALSVVNGLSTLNLESCNDVKSLKFLVGLGSLASLRISKDGSAFEEVGSARYDNRTQISKLQDKICEKYKLDKPIQKISPATISKPAIKSDLYKKLKPLLASNNHIDVTQGFSLLNGCSEPFVFNELVDGVNASKFFTGNSDDLGKTFKATLAADRDFARWKILYILSIAPVEATEAIQLRESIRSITFDCNDSYNDLPPLSLQSFTNLAEIELVSFRGQDLSMLSGLSGLEKITFRDCPNLSSLNGLECASHLRSFQIYSWDGGMPLANAIALANKPKLSAEDGSLDLSCWGNSPSFLESIEFVTSLKSVNSLTANISASTDLKPLLEVSWMHKFSLKFDSPKIDIQHLKNVVDLTIEFPDQDEAPKKKKDAPLRWNSVFTELTSLYLSHGAHDFSQFSAPNIQSVTLNSAELNNLEGFNGAIELDITYCSLPTLAGIEQCQLTKFDLSNIDETTKNIESLKEIATLVELTIKELRFYDKSIPNQLKNFSQIQKLRATRFAGSLSFLEGWKSLEVLDLKQSGELTDLEILNTLPKLEKIRLNGAQMKRESWPAHLQTLLDYKSNDW